MSPILLKLSRSIRAYLLSVVALSVWWAPVPAAEIYPLGVGDRLRVAIQGQPELTTEARIRPPGVIALPFLGTIEAADLTPEALEREIAQRLGRRSDREGCCVSVEILEYRPFFVVGDVRGAGAYPWVPGMTVLHAIAIAGGLGVAPQSQAVTTRAEIARFRERHSQLNDAIAVALTRRARLEAERDGATILRMPEEVLARVGPDRAAALRSAEQRLKDERERVLDSEIDAQLQAKPVFEEEIKAHTAQIEVERRQIGLYTQEIKEFSGVQGRLVPRNLLLNLERQRIQAEGDIRELESFIARARNQIVRVDQAVLRLRNGRRIEITSGLKQVEDELVRSRTGIDEVRRFLAAAGSVEASIGAPSRRVGEDRVTILRPGRNGSEIVPVQGDTPVRPGDLLNVPLQPRLTIGGERTSATQTTPPVAGITATR